MYNPDQYKRVIKEMDLKQLKQHLKLYEDVEEPQVHPQRLEIYNLIKSQINKLTIIAMPLIPECLTKLSIN